MNIMKENSEINSEQKKTKKWISLVFSLIFAFFSTRKSQFRPKELQENCEWTKRC